MMASAPSRKRALNSQVPAPVRAAAPAPPLLCACVLGAGES